MNLLEQLKQYTNVVADTGDFASIEAYKPVDATTNPSLIYAASQDPKYASLVDDAVAYGKKQMTGKSGQLAKAMDKLAVNFGLKISSIPVLIYFKEKVIKAIMTTGGINAHQTPLLTAS